jgi:acetyltransferase-like isoleucine patch superfamily enzyme
MRKYIAYILKFKWITIFYNYFYFKLYKINYQAFPIINGRIKIVGKGEIRIGTNVIFNTGKNYNPIGGDTILRLCAVNKTSKLQIGNNVGISNSTIYCSNSIIIEDNVLIGGSCKIYDTDFHSMDFFFRTSAFKNQETDEEAKKAKVLIKNGAWVGGHCIILKGITIGSRSIIGAGSVVSTNIPDNEIWAGNPIKFIRKI